MRYKLLVYFIFQMITVTTVLGQGPSWPKPESQTYKYTATIVAEIQLSEIPSYSLEDTIALLSMEKSEVWVGVLPLAMAKFCIYKPFIPIKGWIRCRWMFIIGIQIWFMMSLLPLSSEHQGIYGNLTSPMIVHIYPDNDAPLKSTMCPSNYHAISAISAHRYVWIPGSAWFQRSIVDDCE